MRFPSEDDVRGNAQTLGALLASALVIVGAMAVGGYFLFLGGEDGQHDSRYASIDYAVEDGQVVYEHRGGEPVPLDQTDVKLAANGDSVAVPLGELADLGCVREVEAPETLTAGESITIGFAPDCNPDSVNLIYSEGKSGQVLVGDPASASGGQGLLTGDTLSYSSNDSDVEGIRTVKIVITVDGQPTTVETDLADGSFEASEIDGNENLFESSGSGSGSGSGSTTYNFSGTGLDDGTYDSGDTLNLSINSSETSDADSVRTFMLGSTNSSDGSTSSSGTYYVAGGWPEGSLDSDSNTTGSGGDSGLEALAGPDFTVYTGDQITFEAVAYGTGNPIESYHWDFGDGTTAEGQEVTHTYDATGNYTVTLTATDSENNTAADVVNISVLEGATETDSSAVTAVASANTTSVQVGEDVAFDGSASDGENLTYTWDFGDGTATGETVTRSFDTAGTYTVALTVENATASDSDTVEIDVSEADTGPRLAAHWQFDDGSDATTALDSVGSYDGNVTGATYVTGVEETALSFDGTDDFVNVSAAADLNLTDSHVYAFWLRWDGSGSAWSPFVSKRGPSDPSVDEGTTWVGDDEVWDYSNTNDRVGSAQSSVLDGTWRHFVVEYDDGTVRYYLDGEHVGTESLGPADYHGNPMRIGSDFKGNYGAGTLDDVRVYVDGTLGEAGAADLYNRTAAPTADAGPNRSVLVSETVTVDASNTTDPSDDVVEYRWDFDGDGTLDATTTEPTVNHTYEASGNYTLNLTVEDDDGNVDSDTASVTVGSGLIHYYPLEETEGSTAYDRAGTLDADVDVENATLGVRGVTEDGRAYRLEQAGTIQPNASGTDAPWTASFWVNATDNGDRSQNLLDGSDYGLKFNQYDDTHKLGVTEFGVADWVYAHPTPWGSWTHVVYVGTANGTELYVDGQLEDTDSNYIGLPRREIGHDLTGRIDEIRLYDEALSSDEIGTLYAMAAPIADAGPDRTVAVDETVTVDASNTTDPSDDVVEYRWDVDGDGEIDETTSDPTTSHTYTETGTYELALTAVDAANNTDTDTKTVTVESAGQFGLVSHWKLDDDSTQSTAIDAEGVQDGSIRGDPAYVAGANGSSLLFDGNDDVYVDRDYSGGSLTIATWVRPDAVPSSGERDIMWNRGGGNDAYGLTINDGQWRFSLSFDDGTTNGIYAGSPQTDRWYHVVGTWNGSTQRLYVDGEPVGSHTTSANLVDSGNPTYVGSYNGDMEFWKGTVDDVRMYDRGLSAAEVATLYNETSQPTADAGPSRSVAVGETVTFDASNSTHPAGTIVEYRWDVDGDGVIDTNTSTATVDHAYSENGTYKLSVTVVGDDGNFDTDAKTVTVGTAIDDFEDGDISEYGGNTGYFETQTSVVKGGTYALRGTSNNEWIQSMPGDGLGYYPRRGDVVEYYVRIGDNKSGGQFVFGHQDGSNQYRVRHENENDLFRLTRTQGGDHVILDKTNYGWETDTWYRVRLEWADPTITASLYAPNGTKVAEVQADDATFDAGGVGFSTAATYDQTSSAMWFDEARRVNLTDEVIADAGDDRTVEPNQTVTFDASGSRARDAVASYEWDFDGDGSIDATGETVDHTYETTGKRDVTLVVSDEDGDFDTDTVTVTVARIVDDFEDGDVSEYGGSTGSYYAQTSVVAEGTYALRGDSNNENIHSGSGLANYPDRGDVVEYYVRIGDTNSGGQFLFGRQDGSNQYRVRQDYSNDLFRLSRIDGGNYVALDNATHNWQTDTWYRVRLEWGDPTITASLYALNGTKIAEVQADDTTFDAGGIGFSTGASNDQTSSQTWFDGVKILDDS